MLHSEDQTFLQQLGVDWYLNFTSDMSNVPGGLNKLAYISAIDPSNLLSPGAIASLVQSAPSGSYWYVGGEPNTSPGYVSPADFVDVFHYYHTEITNNDPDAKIMSPSLLNWWFTCYGCGGYQKGADWAEDFISRYETKHGIKPPVAAWNIDLYPIDWRGWLEKSANNDPSPFLPNDDWELMRDQITGGTWPILGVGGELNRRFISFAPLPYEGMRAFLDGQGYQDTPIWITEISVHWGYDDIVATLPPGPAGNYRWDDLSIFLNNIFGWLEANADTFLIDRWFLFKSWKNIAQPNSGAFAGIILFGSNEATQPPQAGVTPLNCLGVVYRALSLGLTQVECDANGEP